MKKLFFFAFIFIVLMSLTFLFNAIGVKAAETDCKTISRQFDFVVIKGEMLKANLNKRLDFMRLYAYKNGKMEPVPFQIDEINDDGDWVLDKKSPYLKESQAAKVKLIEDDPPKVLDENDELAFMIYDSGDKAPQEKWPAGWLIADEVTLTDPLTNEKSWVYLFNFNHYKKYSRVNYVDYIFPKNEKKDRIRSDIFTLGFSHIVPITWDYISYDNKTNVIDRMKIRISARLFKIFNLSWTENDLDSELWQYKDGPVRVIRMVRSRLKLISRLKSPGIYSETLYYRNAVLMPFRIKVAFSAKGVTDNAKFVAGADFRDLYGWKVRSNTDDRWLSVDGKMDDLENNIKKEGSRWFIIKDKGKANIVYLHFVGDFAFRTKFSYLDDEVTEIPPEFYPAQVPYAGFEVLDLENIPKGTFHFHVLSFFVNKELSDEELLRVINILDSPIKKEVKVFKKVNVK